MWWWLGCFEGWKLVLFGFGCIGVGAEKKKRNYIVLKLKKEKRC
jgi:hypothetical protein